MQVIHYHNNGFRKFFQCFRVSKKVLRYLLLKTEKVLLGGSVNRTMYKIIILLVEDSLRKSGTLDGQEKVLYKP